MITDEQYVELARRMFNHPIEVDEDALVSLGALEQGAFVQAWVWVPNPELEGGL